MSQARFQKRQREKAKQEKLAAKRERKAARAEQSADPDDGADDAVDAPPESTVLAQLAALHRQFDDEAIDFDTFEERKAELLGQLDL